MQFCIYLQSYRHSNIQHTQSLLCVWALQDDIKESPHTRWNISPTGLCLYLLRNLKLNLGLPHVNSVCLCVSVCVCLFCQTRDKRLCDLSPPTISFSLAAPVHLISPSPPSLLLPLLSAPFERTHMINRDLREHGRGMVVAVGGACMCMCMCALMHSRAKPVGGRWTTEASNVYRGTAGGLGWASLFSDWLTQASSGSETHNWLRKIHKWGRNVHGTKIRHLTSWWRDERQG